jgi:hypothetical protein
VACCYYTDDGVFTQPLPAPVNFDLTPLHKAGFDTFNRAITRECPLLLDAYFGLYKL